MSRRLFCGSQAPPSLTPELLPVPVELAKETRLTVKNQTEKMTSRTRIRGTRSLLSRCPEIYDCPDQRDTREQLERESPGSLVRLSFPFLSFPLRPSFLFPFSSFGVCTFTYIIRISPTAEPDTGTVRKLARARPLTAARGLFGCVIYAELPRSCN